MITKRTKFNRIAKLLARLLKIKRSKYLHFRMESWIVNIEGVNSTEPISVGRLRANGPECQTAGCLAGECFIMAAPAKKIVVLNNLGCGWASEVKYFAEAWLGLDPEEAAHMFRGEWASAPGGARVWMDQITLEMAIKYLRKVLRKKDVRVFLDVEPS